MKAKTIVGLVLALLVLIVHAQNTQVITFHLFFWSFSMSQIVLMVILLGMGFVTGAIATIVWKRRGQKVQL